MSDKKTTQRPLLPCPVCGAMSSDEAPRREFVERLVRIEQCARYLVNSNAWVGDTDGIEANLDELKELLNAQ